MPKHTKNFIITTERFKLRPLDVNDVGKRYLSWINRSDKSQFINYAHEERTIEELRKYVESKAQDESVLFLGIFLRSNGEHIGNIKYEPINLKERQAVMGILIGESNWRGKGVASEVILSSSEWLNKELGIKKIFLTVDPSNHQAIKAYQKTGFLTDIKNNHKQSFMHLVLE